ncbi:lytic transglycosylase domain-containing protein [Aquabacterium sp. A7-Y]|uniref:lytic transglycosylase domain-containing protein n=1 Tax=Aquabacterium sp. A7-Y TaxID=1349605 RepID=UPI00223CCD06|nr:lytic transglycosylase domain-containing protein [Aquabacterium sp. A7-Y]MCW7539310.1 lytic transglycosylase domain-containing protein [Aquabacterium sp. A7-Y]
MKKANSFNSVYRRTLAASVAAAGLMIAALPTGAGAQGDPVLEARDALRRRDAGRLAVTKAAAAAQQHPLAMWPDYWELMNRLPQATPEEVSAFAARWPGTYVEDRLRNDWLLELGRRNDWSTFLIELPKFRMQDDREVACYAVLAQRESIEDLRAKARAAWLAQREADAGCSQMALTLHQAGVLNNGDVWRKARLSAEAGRRNAARQAIVLIGTEPAGRFDELYDNAARYLARKASSRNRTEAELATLAIVRIAAADPEAAAAQLEGSWAERLPQDLAAFAWAAIGRQAGIRLSPRASEFYQRASSGAREREWSEDMLGWKARAALRAGRWQQVSQAINAMGETEQADPTWVYWKARALQALARDSQDGEKLRSEASELLASIAGQHHFYGALATEDLGRPLMLPARPAPLTEEEREAARRNPGLARALQLIGMGLRGEGVREWNWTLGFGGAGRSRMNDRELLAAAQLACEREIWDRCINTSDRTQAEFHIEQRFPMPFRQEVVARAREIGLDPAYVYGLMRQESRFVMDARSHVGASGLMQLMPATARWTARRIGLAYSPDMITDRNTNIALGTSYLKLVLDDLGGSQAMGAAAYNAGPNRPRRWREGGVLETPIWVETIPFTETRDYVKKVLSNATYYGAQITGRMPSLKARLGATVGPRDPNAPAPQTDLP